MMSDTVNTGVSAANWQESLKQLERLRAMLNNDRPARRVMDGLKKLLGSYYPQAYERLGEIADSYERMCDYLVMGYKDSHRESLYGQLACQLFALISDMELALRRKFDPMVMGLLPQHGKEVQSVDELRRRAESFVSSSALLSLSPEPERKAKARELYASRHDNLSAAFQQIVVSPQWSRDMARDMEQVVLSPTVDTVDSQVLTSAIMMAALLVPDAGKVMALMHIFSQATDEKLRQRAFVGWVLALDAADYRLFDFIRDGVSKTLDDPQTRNDMLELQMQAVYCMNAERDNETIRRDVMPTLLKNQSLEITKYGIKEKVDDPMEDILHADAADKKMEQLEASIHRMAEMQKQGADIYFGGFSQMKRFGFFFTLSNWFMPFYTEHPQLSHLSEKLLKGFLPTLLSHGPFCESDKYSFALGMSSIFDRLPDNIKEMVSNGSAEMQVAGMSDAPTDTPAFIRRLYLQDLYRFFRINDSRRAFHNPFDDGTILMLNKMYLGKLHDEALRADVFLLRQGLYGEAVSLLDAYYDDTRADDMLMNARLKMRGKQYAEAASLYRRVLDTDAESRQALKGYALASFYAGSYGEAVEEYRKLAGIYPEQKLYKLNLAISLINDHEVEEGVKILYELYYNDPQSANIKRALAWGQLCMKRLDQAAKLYEDILQGDDKTEADYLNAGYCAWFKGDYSKAVGLMRGHVDNVEMKLREDDELLSLYGIDRVERLIMEGMIEQ